MPMLLLWATPAAVVFSNVGFYLIAVAEFVDGAIALTAAAAAPAQRPKFKVIQGGKY
jgi:hypothetical protein